MPQEVATLRRDVREMLDDITKQIDDLVLELLQTRSTAKSVGSGTLDEYFKKT